MALELRRTRRRAAFVTTPISTGRRGRAFVVGNSVPVNRPSTTPPGASYREIGTASFRCLASMLPAALLLSDTDSSAQCVRL